MKKKSKKKGKVNKAKTFRTVGIGCVVIAITVTVMLITNSNGGYYNNAKKCDPGKYPSGSKCVTCPQGSYCNGSKRNYCPKGTGSLPGSRYKNDCTNCAKGYYSKGDGNGCMACKVGEYQDKAGQTSCKKCPSGTTTTEKGQTSCKKITCKNGEYLNGTKCVTCPKGSYCVDNVKTPCPKGMYQDEAGKTSCKACSGNKKTKSTGAVSSASCNVKTVCKSGEYLYESRCIKCTAGSYCVRDQMYQCSKGTYQNESGKSTCKSCPVGTTTSSIGATSCSVKNVCPEGYYGKDGKGPCTICPKGSYQDEEGQSSCIFCAVGLTTSSAGAKTTYACNVTTDCPAGYYGKNGKGPCYQCKSGTYQNKTGQSSCVKCPVGTYQKYMGEKSCERCPAGTYQDKTGQTSCISCPKGTRSNAGATSVKQCVKW